MRRLGISLRNHHLRIQLIRLGAPNRLFSVFKSGDTHANKLRRVGGNLICKGQQNSWRNG